MLSPTENNSATNPAITDSQPSWSLVMLLLPYYNTDRNFSQYSNSHI